MRKSGYQYLLICGGLLLSVIVFLSGPGPGALDSEIMFDAEVHNSLYYLDRAKLQWAEEKLKSEQAVPTMKDLAPYLGDWTNRIERLAKLGIKYTITPISDLQHQTDVATLSRDLRFRRGYSRFYPAGTTLCLQTGWAHSPYTARSLLQALYLNNQYLLAAALFVVAMGSLLFFVVRKFSNPKVVGGPSA